MKDFMEVPYINLNGVNCWIVNQIPFAGDNKTDENIISHQEACREEKVFGIGWRLKKGDMEDWIIKSGGELNVCIAENSKFIDNYAESYAKAHGASKDKSLIGAMEKCKEIKEGDYVIMRHKNSHYYIGRVNGSIKYAEESDSKALNVLSWYGTVREWQEFQGENALPTHIVGRLSQRHQKTIERIQDERIKLLLISALNKVCEAEDKEFDNIPRLKVNKYNFCRSLNYMELEDLVFYYIYNKHKKDGYICFPSSGKINREKFEYSFISPEPGRKPITCQVKNQAEIDPDNYKDEEKYKIIYLFSGLWDDDKVEKLNKEYKKDIIKIISPSELFSVLISNQNIFKFSEYYVLEERKEILKFLDKKRYQSVKRYSSKNNDKIQYKYDEKNGRIDFFTGGLFYLEDFNALIKDNSEIIDDNLVKKIKEDIELILNSK